MSADSGWQQENVACGKYVLRVVRKVRGMVAFSEVRNRLFISAGLALAAKEKAQLCKILCLLEKMDHS